jgi:DNA-binding response OmpR family regulator
MKDTEKRILIVDDDPDIGTMLKMMLEFKNYSSVITDRADKAKEIIGNDPHSIQLILMDMLLSGVNGIDVCTGLKKDPVTANIPVIMISAHPNAREMCIDAGADDFIPKPFDMQDILSRIDNLINKT